MVEIHGPSIRQVDRRADRFVAVIDAEMRRIAKRAANNLGHVTVAQGRFGAASVNDVNIIKTLWNSFVDSYLIQLLASAMFSSSSTVSENINRAVGRPISDPVGEQTASELAMKNARNQLVNIGDDLWSDAQDELTEGMQEGESIPTLAKRVMGAVDVAAPRAEVIARTEIIRASNSGSIMTMRASGLVVRKKWLATPDARTRVTHREANDQLVGLDDPFIVGGSTLDHPGDPLGPPEETINCRCVMLYDVDESELDDVDDEDLDEEEDDDMPLTSAANEDYENEGMIALIPTEDDAKRLALPNGETPDRLHVTVAYLGEIDAWTDEQRQLLIDELSTYDWSTDDVDWSTRVFGVNHWNPDGDDPVWVLAVGGEALDEVHFVVWDVLNMLQATEDIPELPVNHKPWVPHMTLAYDDDHSILADAAEKMGDVKFDRLAIVLGSDVTDIPLRGDTLA